MSYIFDEDYYVPLLRATHFPNPHFASNKGLLAYGGDLSSHTILSAYRKGIFPWYSKEDPILWWSPNPRLLLYPKDFYVRKSFRRVLRSERFSVTFDCHFKRVVGHCSSIFREGQVGSWILPEMIEAFVRLHEEGFAHSVEVHYQGELVGGLYGLAIGKSFVGESMFSLIPDASKVAFKALSDVLAAKGYDFIDCQLPTDHMKGLGALEVDRSIFLNALRKSLFKPTDFGNWKSDFAWTYQMYNKE